MGKIRIIVRKRPSQAIKDLGLELEREYGIRPLADGETRPPGYYTPNHYTARALRPAAEAAQMRTVRTG